MGGQEAAASLIRYGVTVKAGSKAMVKHYTQLLETRVKANASGRPGPRAPTGNYRRSIRSKFLEYEGDPVGAVGSDAPQARRLELGFNDIDSLGRRYSQPPYAHFGPAVDQLEGPFYIGMRALLDAPF